MNLSRRLRGPVGLTALFLLFSCASLRDPAISEEGFPKLSGTGFDAVYLDRDNDPRSFQHFSVQPCTVSFRENWLRDQNLERAPRSRVTTEDMRRIEKELAADCQETLVEALSEMTGAPSPQSAGPGALMLRPSIVELDVAAPAVLTPGRESNYTSSAVRMTLRLELADASTGASVGRIIDRRVAGETGRTGLATRSGNKAESERILRTWAVLLVDLLEGP